MEKLYRVLLANSSEDFGAKLAAALAELGEGSDAIGKLTAEEQKSRQTIIAREVTIR